MSHDASLTLLPPVPALELTGVHRYAVSFGLNDTMAPAETEARASPVRLLGLAVQRLPDVSFCTYVVQSHMAFGKGRTDPLLGEIVVQMMVQAAGTIRLCQRALEVHGPNVGYELGEWSSSILETTSALLHLVHLPATSRGEARPTPIGEVRRATCGISRAITACESDRMAVPEYLSEAIGRLLVLFMLACELDERHYGRR
jgi:hypothetical protein